MEKRTEGAWLVHHTQKLQDFKNVQDFEDIEFAGKCGVFLSNLAASQEQSDIDKDTVDAIRKVSNIKKTEIEAVKSKLEDFRLIEKSKDGSLSVLGVTTSTVLSHTSDMFNDIAPNNYQRAVIDLSEKISDLPKNEKELREYISDSHKLPTSVTFELFNQAEEIGFVDFEKLDNDSKLYFNGNLFRRDSAEKANAVISSLKSTDATKIAELDILLTEKGCVPLAKVESILGNELLSKLQSIGMYDFNEISNSTDTKVFVTKPAAFSKYGNPFEEDALDLAKAFVTSLYYGMNDSVSSRGKIQSLKLLLGKLISGDSVGPATAIGEDYRILEYRRVVKLTPSKSYKGRYYMRLLKRDIGELALHVLEQGDATEATIGIHSGSVIGYVGPETKRGIQRKLQNKQSKESVANLLRTFRSS